MSSSEDYAYSATTDDEFERMSTASSEFSIISSSNIKKETFEMSFNEDKSFSSCDELSQPSSISSSFSQISMGETKLKTEKTSELSGSSKKSKPSENRIKNAKTQELTSSTAAKLAALDSHLSKIKHNYSSPPMALQFTKEIMDAYYRGDDLGDVYVRMDQYMNPQGLFWPVEDPNSTEKKQPVVGVDLFTPDDIKEPDVTEKKVEPKKLMIAKEKDGNQSGKTDLDNLYEQRQALTNEVNSVCDELGHHTYKVKELTTLVSESIDKLLECNNKIKNYNKKEDAE